MNVLHLSRFDIAGGAAQATYQIHTLLRNAGHRSVMAVRHKTSSDPDVVTIGARSLLASGWDERMERIRSRLMGGYRVTSSTLQYFNRNMGPIPDLDTAFNTMPRPDVLFLHWITTLLTAADIRRLHQRLACPIVWVLLDMEPMTGGCHYPGACTCFQSSCSNCPQLHPRKEHDWAERTWKEKFQHLSDLPITFLAPTQWLGERLASSGLFRGHPVTRIPLPMNARMRPVNKAAAKDILGMPLDRKIVLVGSQNLKEPRKGMDLLIEATRLLEAKGRSETGISFRNQDLLFWLMGAEAKTLAKALPFPSHDAGYVRNDIVLSLTYQAADVFACPSLEDAGPMMVSQAMLCGTPAVTFDTGIAPELITSGQNGYIARLGDASDFAAGLERLLADDGTAGKLAAAQAARHHDPSHLTHSFNLLLNELTQEKGLP